MSETELSKTIDFYRKQFLSLDQSIPNSILLTASVLLVFVAGNKNFNLFIWASILFFSISLLTAILCLKQLKKMTLLAVNDLSDGQQQILDEVEKMREEKIIANAEIAKRLDSIIKSHDTHAVGQLRDKFNLLENLSIWCFSGGILSLLIGLVYPQLLAFFISIMSMVSNLRLLEYFLSIIFT